MPFRSLVFPLLAPVFLAPLLTGCSNRPARVPAPRINPQAIMAAVFEQADTNGDGSLRGQEQQTVPAIAAAAARLNADADGAVSREELRAWLEAVRDSRVAITPLEVVVAQRGRLLAGVMVRLVPEPLMGGEVKAAEGTTDADGVAAVTIPDATYPGVNCGLYRVEITGTGTDGKPLPGRVNTATMLGVAVGAGVPETGSVQLVVE
jgi:hypothetical protein